MSFFQSSEEFYQILIPFFNKLKDDPEIGPKVLASNLIIKFSYNEPEAVVIVDCPNSQVIQGDVEGKKIDVEMTMKSDTAHKFWLGKVNLMASIFKGEIKAKGPIPKIMKLLPAIKNSFTLYNNYLKEIGKENLIEIQ